MVGWLEGVGGGGVGVKKLDPELGQKWDFREGGLRYRPGKADPCRGVLGHPPPDIFFIILVKGISSILVSVL